MATQKINKILLKSPQTYLFRYDKNKTMSLVIPGVLDSGSKIIFVYFYYGLKILTKTPGLPVFPCLYRACRFAARPVQAGKHRLTRYHNLVTWFCYNSTPDSSQYELGIATLHFRHRIKSRKHILSS